MTEGPYFSVFFNVSLLSVLFATLWIHVCTVTEHRGGCVKIRTLVSEKYATLSINYHVVFRVSQTVALNTCLNYK